MTKSILVTGASTGIGEACALHLDTLGHRVFAGVRKEDDAGRLREQASERLVPVFLDVTDDGQIDTVAKQIDADSGALYGLVNNAGIGRGGPLEYLPLDEWRDQLEVNVIGQVAVTRAMLPLPRRDRGRIVFIGSIGGRMGSALMGPYTASKFAIEGIGECLRLELHQWGLHVAVVEPGAIKTKIWEKAHDTMERLERDLPEEAFDRYAPHLEVFRKNLEDSERRGVGPERVAKAVEHALFARRPKDRYLVGLDARVMGNATRVLPDKARGMVVRRFAGP